MKRATVMQGLEPLFIEALDPELAGEALDVGVLGGRPTRP